MPLVRHELGTRRCQPRLGTNSSISLNFWIFVALIGQLVTNRTYLGTLKLAS